MNLRPLGHQSIFKSEWLWETACVEEAATTNINLLVLFADVPLHHRPIFFGPCLSAAKPIGNPIPLGKKGVSSTRDHSRERRRIDRGTLATPGDMEVRP